MSIEPTYTLSATCQQPEIADILVRHLGFRTSGYFVEVGAFDGKTFSYTNALSMLGWDGLLFEPNPDSFDLCDAYYRANPNVDVYQLCIGQKNERVPFVLKGPSSSKTLNTETGVRDAADSIISVEQITLDHALKRYGKELPIDLIVVDVEGFESDVFACFSLQVWQPRVIIVELNQLSKEFPRNTNYVEIDQTLRRSGYDCVYVGEVDSVYVSRIAIHTTNLKATREEIMRSGWLARRQFQEHLLAITIARAVNRSKFYSEHLKLTWAKVRSTDDLYVLPTTDKPKLRSVNTKDLLTSDEQPACIQNTSGTTDVPFHVYRGIEEVRIVQEFFKRDVGALSAGDLRVLCFQPPYHGQPLSIPVHTDFENLDISKEGEKESVISRAIGTDWLTEKPIILTGICDHILAFTALLNSQGFDFSKVNAMSVSVTGQPLTKRQRSILQNAWNVRVSNRYSLTEGFGGAIECQKCGAFHFDQYTIAEVLDWRNPGRKSSSFGLLHLTSLYPFVQLMPFIRYRTNDVVEVIGTECDELYGQSYVFHGRWHSAIKFGDDKIGGLLPAGPFLYMLDCMDKVRRDTPLNLPRGLGVGRPMFNLSYDEDKQEVILKVESVEDCTPDEMNSLRDELTKKASEVTKRFIGDLSIETSVEVLAPNQIIQLLPYEVPDTLDSDSY